MHIPNLIQRKRDGEPLTAAQIQHLVAGLTDGSIPDYQWSALAMAIFFQGMTPVETAALTLAMRDSGETLSYPAGHPRIVDKHSTGGIGDKVSLVLAPLLACCGVWVPMVSGRGLGITGGTLDKLESIPGFRVGLSTLEMQAQLEAIGVFIAGQTATFCPADRKLYALRDVTATVPSIPLIVASILSKKLAENLDALVLDVKYGAGAFMQTKPDAEKLAAAMEAVGRVEGIAISSILNPMDEPLGRTAGNALEVQEALDCLSGHGPQDLIDITLDLAYPLVMQTREQLTSLLESGQALRKFEAMVAHQGGDLAAFIHREMAPHIIPVMAKQSGTITRCDARILGQAVVELGGGRATATDQIDPVVGLSNLVKCGESVQADTSILCCIHARTAAAAAQAAANVEAAFAYQLPT